jgi:glutamyl aminopeptidase
VKFDIPADTTWIKVNVNQSGFYRVTYSDDMWQSIILALRNNYSVFSPADRASLIDDAFTLCRFEINAVEHRPLPLFVLY